MPTYTESEVPTVISTGGNNGGMWGSDGIWAILLLALLGFGGRGWGAGGYGGGSEMVGYELGKVATQADVASGFNNSAVLSSLNDIKLGQANMQNWINQGFYGIDRTTSQGFNALSSQLASCCCDIRTSLLENRYINERQTCDLITNANANTQRILDYLYNEKLCGLQAENSSLKGQLSQNAQTAAIVGALAPKAPVAAYTVPNPNCCYNSCGCGGASIQ